MTCRRQSLVTTFTRTLRLRPSFAAHFVAGDDRDCSGEPRKLPPLPPSFQPNSYASFFGRSAAGFGGRRSLGVLLPIGVDPLLHLHRNYSSSAEGSNELSYIKDVTDVLSDGSLDAAASAAAAAPPAPFPGEVAAAAADSFLPVAVLQHVIDSIHSFTGLNWWACIALTTLLIRGATIPLLLNQMKATVKLNLMRPELEQLKEQMQSSVQDPQAMQESQQRVKALFKKHGVTPLTPLKGLFIQGPVFISFFLAISNMVEKVPSFKGGGAFWFTDLTTPDTLYIFPVLTALTFLATVELNMQEGMEGNPMANTMKNFSRVIGLLTVPFTAHFPKKKDGPSYPIKADWRKSRLRMYKSASCRENNFKAVNTKENSQRTLSNLPDDVIIILFNFQAIFCYWVTSNIFSLLYGVVLRQPPVRKFLDLPAIVPQLAPSKPPSFSFFGKSNLLAPAASTLPTKEPEQPRTSERRVSSSAVISQRIKNLEKTVKARNKPRKR